MHPTYPLSSPFPSFPPQHSPSSLDRERAAKEAAEAEAEITDPKLRATSRIALAPSGSARFSARSLDSARSQDSHASHTDTTAHTYGTIQVQPATGGGRESGGTIQVPRRSTSFDEEPTLICPPLTSGQVGSGSPRRSLGQHGHLPPLSHPVSSAFSSAYAPVGRSSDGERGSGADRPIEKRPSAEMPISPPAEAITFRHIGQAAEEEKAEALGELEIEE